MDLTTLGFTEQQIKGDKILDVGCGTSAVSTLQGPNIYGLDPNLGKDCLTIYNPERTKKALAEQIPYESGFFDHSFSRNTVGFYPRQINLELAVKEMLRVVKPSNGTVRFNTGQEMDYELLESVIQRLMQEGYEIAKDSNLFVIVHPENDLGKVEFYKNPYDSVQGTRLTDRILAKISRYIGKKIIFGNNMSEALITDVQGDELFFLSYSHWPECPRSIDEGSLKLNGAVLVDPQTRKLIFKGDGRGWWSITTIHPHDGKEYHDLKQMLDANKINPRYG